MTGGGRSRLLAASSALFLASPLLPFALAPVERLLRRKRAQHVSRTALPSDPFVEVIIPAYLESSIIGATVERLTADLTAAGLRHRVHVIASDDATAQAAAGAGKVTRTGRDGKPAAVNLGVGHSDAEVVVLTDANCDIGPADWPRIMLAELAVTDLLSGNKSERLSPEALFWRFESLVKRAGIGRSSTLAVVGEFLAFRRGQFRPVPPTTMADDLWLALDFHTRGLTVSTSPRITTSEAPVAAADQWERRARIADGVLSEAVPRAAQLARTPVGRHYLAHKLYRVTVGVVAFWTSAAALAGRRPPITVPLVSLVVAASIAQYRGRITMTTPLNAVGTVVAMQAVPVVAASRVLRRRLRGETGTAGWTKVVR